MTPGEGSLAAEKGFTRETGNLLFHIALVLVLVGVALGALFGWKGTVIVREGNGFANTLTQYDSFSPGRLASPDRLPPFAFTMSDFEATFEREGSQRGAPRSFAATLEYSAEPGAPGSSGWSRSTRPCGWTGPRSSSSATATHRTSRSRTPPVGWSSTTPSCSCPRTAASPPRGW